MVDRGRDLADWRTNQGRGSFDDDADMGSDILLPPME